MVRGKIGVRMIRPIVLKISMFVVLAAILVFGLSSLFTPRWNEQLADTIDEFYSQPRDTIQVILLGTSSTQRMSANELYGDYGICAFNLGMPSEPLLASYYWIQEVERFHGNSLNTVVLDVSSLFKTDNVSNKIIHAERCFARMKMSPVKIKALLECNEHYRSFPIGDFFVPLFRYHSRWAELDSEEYETAFGDRDRFCNRGQRLSFNVSADTLSDDEILVPLASITPEIDHSQAEMDDAYIDYCEKMLVRIITYCKQRDLDLILMKTPTASWNDLRHDAVQVIADKYSVPFIDYMQPDVIREAGLYFPLDYADKKHANVRGGEKLARYLGGYLVTRDRVSDIRDDERYDFMQAKFDGYSSNITDAALTEAANIEDYLALLDNSDYTVFCYSCGDVSGLGAQYGRQFEEIGFGEIAGLGKESSFIGILSSGRTEVQKTESETVNVSGVYSTGRLQLENPNLQRNASIDGMFTIEAGMGESSFTVNGQASTVSECGLYFVVFDDKTGHRVDSTHFRQDGDKATGLVSDGYQNRLDDALGK